MAHCRGCYAVNDALQWATALRDQAERFVNAFGNVGLLGAIEDDALSVRVAYEAHFLLIAANQLRLVLERAPKKVGLTCFDENAALAIQWARNVHEHQDAHLHELRKDREPTRAAAKFVERFGEPDDPVSPWTIACLGLDHDFMVAGLSAKRLRSFALQTLEEVDGLRESGNYHTLGTA